MKNNNIAI